VSVPGIAAAAALALLTAGAAHASIPPTYRVLVVSSDAEARARGEALVQYMSAQEAFFRAEPALSRYDLAPCLTGADFAACARPLVPATAHWQEPATVVVRVERAGDARLALTCVGSGAHRPPEPGQAVEVDPRQALFGDGEDRIAALRAAMGCIQSAAAESVRP
jgi:hypothetical protein